MNILWIITDDQMRITLSRMPKVWSRLVKRGTRFTRGYSAVPLCGPARASILSSMYPHNHECVTNSTNPRFVALGHDHDTVATRLKEAGYATGYFGKYLNGHNSTPEYVAPGWDRWVTSVHRAGQPFKFNMDGRVRGLNGDPDAFASRHLLGFLENRPDTPWFAVFAASNPHSPYLPSRKHEHDFDKARYRPPSLNERNMADKPTWMRGTRMQRTAKIDAAWEGKLEELRDLDDQIGRILDTLYKTGQLGRTWIFMVSDNGYMLGEHRMFKKERPYEESAGIPYVVRGPGVPVRADPTLVSQVDLMPTTLDIAGLNPHAGRALDGRSMLPHLTGGDWSGWRKRLLVEHPKSRWAMLREGPTAYVDHYEADEFELYDLADDPYQMSSIADVDTAPLKVKLTALRGAKGAALRQLEEA